MRNVLIVSKKKELGDALAKLIRPFRFDRIEVTDSAQDARRRVQRGPYALVLINTPLSHELGTELALDIINTDGPEVVLIASSEALSKIEMKLGSAPVFIVQKPINKEMILRDLRYILNSQQKREKLLEQNSKLTEKMQNLKTQFRAKLLLMEHLSMSEEEAHRYIQKQSMDSRRTPGAVSKAIINMYEK